VGIGRQSQHEGGPKMGWIPYVPFMEEEKSDRMKKSRAVRWEGYRHDKEDKKSVEKQTNG